MVTVTQHVSQHETVPLNNSVCVCGVGEGEQRGGREREREREVGY